MRESSAVDLSSETLIGDRHWEMHREEDNECEGRK